MSSNDDGRSVPSTKAYETDSSASISDLPAADGGEQDANVKGGVLKTRHDTVKNSIGN